MSNPSVRRFQPNLCYVGTVNSYCESLSAYAWSVMITPISPAKICTIILAGLCCPGTIFIGRRSLAAECRKRFYNLILLF